jgi:hypothetical protein
MRRSLLLTVTFAALAVPATARADDDEEEQMVIVETPVADPPPEAPPVMVVKPVPSSPERWVDVRYSSQTLMLDGAAVAMFAFGAATEVQPLPGLGILTYAFGPPIVHFSHGNVGKGFADMGIRIVSPFLFAMPGLMIAMAVTPREGEERKTAMDVGGYTGMALGAAFAMAVDALVLAKDRVPEERAYFRDDASRSVRGNSASASSARRASAHP